MANNTNWISNLSWLIYAKQELWSVAIVTALICGNFHHRAQKYLHLQASTRTGIKVCDFWKISFLHLNFNQFCTSYLNMLEPTPPHTHAHTQTLTNTPRPSLERQQLTLKELTLWTRSRHQPLISPINYWIATRRQHAARKWKQKSTPEANSQKKQKTNKNRKSMAKPHNASKTWALNLLIILLPRTTNLINDIVFWLLVVHFLCPG